MGVESRVSSLLVFAIWQAVPAVDDKKRLAGLNH
jgi:hypothetical protein